MVFNPTHRGEMRRRHSFTVERLMSNASKPAATLMQRIGLDLPLIQAPMAGISTPAMAVAVTNAGALGFLAVGAMQPHQAHEAIAATRALTHRPFGVNVFCHAPARRDAALEAAWLNYLAPEFQRFGATAPDTLREIYPTFLHDAAMQELLLRQRPAVVSFHFGLPDAAYIAALRERGIVTFATATSLDEAARVQAAGVDAIVAQGIEAGGHRGIFDADAAADEGLPTQVLVRLLVREQPLPVIAAGGIMDGAGIAAALALGAQAAQLGTAFVTTDESAADAAYRQALLGSRPVRTTLTRAVSGRPARGLSNRLTVLGQAPDAPRPPDYPVTYDAGKALHAAARGHGERGYAAHWAGQGAALVRALPAAQLVQVLASELAAARAE